MSEMTRKQIYDKVNDEYAPIAGITFPNPADPATWNLSFKDEATSEQRAAATSYILGGTITLIADPEEPYLDRSAEIDSIQEDMAEIAALISTKLTTPTGTEDQVLDGTGNPKGLSVSYPSRTLDTVYKPSATRWTLFIYSVSLEVNALVGTASEGKVTPQYADDNGMNTNLVTLPHDSKGFPSGLAVTSKTTLRLIGLCPPNKFMRLVKENVAGTPTFGAVVAQEIQF